jgi:hypothetical protein
MDAVEIKEIADHIKDTSQVLGRMDAGAIQVELNHTSFILSRLRLAGSTCADPDNRAVLERLLAAAKRFNQTILLRTGMNN